MGFTIHNIEGERFGCLTAIRLDHRDAAGRRFYWLCRCDCGKECYVERQKLISGRTKSCGHLRATSMSMTRGHFARVDMPENVKKWILKHYCHTKNREIMERFGLTEGTLHRFARANGLAKTTQFLRKVQREAADAARASHLRNGTYPPKGYVIPGSEKGAFRPGHKETKKVRDKRIEKATATMREIRKSERARLLLGWQQKTKLKLEHQSKRRLAQRYFLRKHGYIIARGSNTAYYNEDTDRCLEFEQRKPSHRYYCWWDFKPAEDIHHN